MTASQVCTILVATVVVHGCGVTKQVVPLTEHAPYAPVPRVLEEGRATRADVAMWTSVIRRDESLVERDLNADGRKDLLAENVGARGTTGNRSFLAFAAGSRGYRFSGTTGNIDRLFRFPSGNAYVLDRGVCGPELGFGLSAVSRGSLVRVGAVHLMANTDADADGEAADVRLRDRLLQGEWSEAELRAVFTPVRANPSVERAPETD